MKKIIQVSCAVMLFAGTLSAAEFITAAAAGDFIGNGKAVLKNGETVINGRCSLYSKKFLKIDTKKSYRLSGEFKALPNGKTGDSFRIGVSPSTRYSQIQSFNVNIVAGTETELAADCSASDKILKLKDASKWKGGPLCTVAFEVDPSGKLQDLPNFNVSKIGAVSLVRKSGYWELTLKHPCGKNLPAGTTVREHRPGWSVIYAGGAKRLLTPEWKKVEFIIPPGTVPAASITRWWKGTAKAAMLVESMGSGMVFRNLKLEELTGK